MSKVFSADAVSVDGYISGRHPSDAEGTFGRAIHGYRPRPIPADQEVDPDQPERCVDRGGGPS